MGDDDNGNDTPKVIKKISPWLKIVAVLVTICVAVGGVVFSMEERYSKQVDVAKSFLLAEEQTVKTFNQVQMQFKQFSKQQDIKFYQRELRELNDRHILIEREIAKHPNNSVLKEERTRITSNKTTMRQKLDELMER